MYIQISWAVQNSGILVYARVKINVEMLNLNSLAWIS